MRQGELEMAQQVIDQQKASLVDLRLHASLKVRS
jgi:hypothetical protein